MRRDRKAGCKCLSCIHAELKAKHMDSPLAESRAQCMDCGKPVGVCPGAGYHGLMCRFKAENQHKHGRG